MIVQKKPELKIIILTKVQNLQIIFYPKTRYLRYSKSFQIKSDARKQPKDFILQSYILKRKSEYWLKFSESLKSLIPKNKQAPYANRMRKAA